MGLVSVTIRSLIQVWSPFNPITLTSLIVPFVGIVIVEVIVGVPAAEIVTGTSVDETVKQPSVVKLNELDQADAPQPDTALTLQ